MFNKYKCFVKNCGKIKNNKNKISLFGFPKLLKSCCKLEKLSRLRQKKWKIALRAGAIKDNNLLAKFCVTCSDHFTSGKPASILDKENVDWIPTLNLEKKQDEKRKVLNRVSVKPIEIETYEVERVTENAFSTNEPDSCIVNTELSNKSIQVNPEIKHCKTQTETPLKSDKLMQTEVSCVDEVKMAEINKFLQMEITELQKKLKKVQTFAPFSKESLKCNTKKTMHFTGLKFQTLEIIYEFWEQDLADGTKINKSKFELLVLTLMRLRVDFSFTTIAVLFDISVQSARKYFQQNLHTLYKKFISFIVWPTRKQLLKSTPKNFKKVFKNGITIIIDCFEVNIERPNNELTARQCWSNYKSSYTIKYLIGISPNGCITFISPGYGGRCSDKFITENCGFLEKISEGDYVMADRGFLIADTLKKAKASLIIPAFTKNKNQLHPIEVEDTRKIANVRIHVERVIGLLRNKFHILSKRKFPITSICHSENDVTEIDKIVTVCSALVNLSPPIVF